MNALGENGKAMDLPRDRRLFIREESKSRLVFLDTGVSGEESGGELVRSLDEGSVEVEGSTAEVVFPSSGLSRIGEDADFFVQLEGEGSSVVVVRDARSGRMIRELNAAAREVVPPLEQRVSLLGVSPLATFITTWARKGESMPEEGSNGGERVEGNLVVYERVSGKKVVSFFQKSFSKDRWPLLQWSDDELIAVRAMTNEVHVYDGRNLAAGIRSKVYIDGVDRVSLSRGPAPFRLGAFAPEKKGAPARVMMFSVGDGAQISTRSAFRADEAKFKWNPNGSAVLAFVSALTDATGKSYYGETILFYLDTQGKLDARVSLSREGDIHDVAWSPNGQGFVVIFGAMPAQAILFDSKNQPIFDFGTGARNTISFSPHGRFLALCGFGNLNGHVEFWDKNKRKLLGTTEMSCTTAHCWSPCSRYFLAATTFPRLRVDNGYRVYTYYGSLLVNIPTTNRLLQAVFLPDPSTNYPDRPASQDVLDGKELKKSASEKKQAYRPPGQRGTTSFFSLHEDSTPGKIEAKRNVQVSIGPDIPGLSTEETLSKSQLKNRRKKAAALRKKDEQEAIALLTSNSADGENEQSNAVDAGGEDGQLELAERRQRTLKKKLKQIESLKLIRDAGSSLDEDQRGKLDSETSILEELEELLVLISKLSG
mmetsp:Transcript_2982/g.5703  ORF Transcript_2982/g.5703 Transcript_2982/m.5703 type:complete len:652 (-) Transcript_2982:1167-3122(-)|eukprot:CAMPEP_0184680934 /NCGR_PEP_ID=MMETSP0312-20130426/3855_1 /TAXON_ID=31354 /ORGANISM="Compsopogon coeruleus, Strain SAG 36.94" /LENGTH=651 /DNA_ID=CAMNT_0027131399 /DNA_START=18 /DNA_END=1973 /DNA_ORIENTATION=-